MNNEKQLLKQRIFSCLEETLETPNLNHNIQERFSLEEVLGSLTQQENKILIINPEEQERKTIEELKEEAIIVEEEPESDAKILLYEVAKNVYFVYVKDDDDNNPVWKNYVPKKSTQEEHNYGLFIPSGVIVRRVPQNILGNGVLGRAWIYSGHIEILDSLHGDAYQEVLTHEVLHILHPEKKEMDIRQMTRNYIGVHNTVYH